LKRIFVTDCEGPITRNDIALELTSHFVPEGDRVFSVLSKYDEVLANLEKGRNYAAGNTLKLVLPFLKAFDVNNRVMEEFSAANLVLLKGSKETLSDVRKISETFVVSTSYEHYIRAFCRAVSFPLENTYCTKLNLDEFEVTAKEKTKLRNFAWEIAGMPIINVPSNATSLHDLSSKEQETVKKLDKIFWKEISGMHCKGIFSDVGVLGAIEKAKAVREIVSMFSASAADVMYVGDSITDAQALNLVRAGGGLAVSINGDPFAVGSAEVAVLSDNSVAISILADLFLRLGKADALNGAGNWDRDFLWRSTVNPLLLDRLFGLFPKRLPKVQIVSEWNKESLAKESSEFRKTVQGESIVKLGNS
jgi:energy-converting hydrogenase A subunit R